MVKEKLSNIIKSQFSLPLKSLHGLEHWESVETTGKRLAASTKADPEVVTLFAYLHDSRRENEDFDPDHGERASLFAQELFKKKVLKITQKQLKNLVTACRFHSDKNARPDNVTIATCWDADRLDLQRMGTIPDPKYLFTEAGKKYNVESQRIKSTIRELAEILLRAYENMSPETIKKLEKKSKKVK